MHPRTGFEEEKNGEGGESVKKSLEKCGCGNCYGRDWGRRRRSVGLCNEFVKVEKTTRL